MKVAKSLLTGLFRSMTGRSCENAFRRSWVQSVSLDKVADATDGKLAGEWRRRAVSSVGTDTRDLEGKDLYFALTGPRFDGHAFLDDAARAGARAAVVSARSTLALDFQNKNPSFPLVLV